MEHRLCPIFRISNVTGEGLDYVGIFPVSGWQVF
jgi:GTPase